MKISIITFSMGRQKYLIDCIQSIYNDIIFNPINSLEIDHYVCFQGVVPDQWLKNKLLYFNNLEENYNIIQYKFEQNIGIGAGLNSIIPLCNGELIFKMDDDCKIMSSNFFHHVVNIHNKFPNSCFNPYPIGLIGNPSGPKGYKHTVWFDKINDEIYTRRHVRHLGGFSRFTPLHIIKNFNFPNDLSLGVSGAEDGNFSNYCNNHNIEMFYLENKICVEHNDSTIGQTIRYKAYFQNRNYEANLNTELIE